MDSVTQFVLGAAVGSAALGPAVPARRAVLWGGILGTLPDLDVLLRTGDAILDMTRHRAESHALFWLTLASPLLALAIVRWRGERRLFARWWLAVWLALVTHTLLDALTIYGTRLWLPFSDVPVDVGSLFVIDPLYTLPLLVGVLALWSGRGSARSRRWNVAGLALSTAYAAWSLVAGAHVGQQVARALEAAGIVAARTIVTPAPFQTLLWRAVAVTPAAAYECEVSLLDDDQPIRFTTIDRGGPLLAAALELPSVQALDRLARGALKAERQGDDLVVSDMRMGSDPHYVFSFRVATIDGAGACTPVEATKLLPFRPHTTDGLAWMWRRMWGDRVPPPR